MGKNAYVKLNIRENGTFLTLYPASEGGRGLILSEIEDYLDKVFGDRYDRAILSDEIRKPLVEQREIKIMESAAPTVNETVVVVVAADRMSVSGRFYPPSEGGQLLTKDDIVNDMIKAGVKYGVSDGNIASFLENRQYGEAYILAEATKQEEGSDAVVTYYFNTDLTQKPKVNEDGSVDFHNLDMISSVTKGALLAELTPAVHGKPGIDVCGGLLRPAKVKQRILRTGKNIVLSEDGLKAYSEVDGHATLEGEQIFVSNMYEVPANVDTSTGDINYEGNVHVHGNVVMGYSIHAKGDIIVDGVVEGATLEAGGNIILKRGIQGMDRGILRANGNVISKFIESANVDAGGYVSADAIMHSHVSAMGDILVDGKKGYITGGVIRSGSQVSAKTIGSAMGTATVLEVGIEPEKVQEYHDLTKELEVLKEEQEKNLQNLMALAKRVKMGEKLPADKMLQLKQANEARENMTQQEAVLTQRVNALKEMIDNYDGGFVRANNTVYSGTKITISNAVHYVKQDISYCRFSKSQGEIKVESYY